ncbi:MAG: helix-turn-helix domain-containing protein [Hydrogenophaga sp.]|uniref:helix-turn-helix domain-containing protein n=1 Tax=Hydrogenophaga sp. TaxID=1904254 RepID=UPI003D9AE2C2
MTPPAPVSLAEAQRLHQIDSARRSLFGEGSLMGGPRVAPWIEQSWRRCLAQGLRPQQRITFDAVSAPAMRHALEANQPLLRAAAPVIRSLARAMADTGYFAILTDAQGVVIDANGPIDHHNRLAHLIARVGVDLSERAVGTTAIGTTLTEQQPVWLHRGEHFFDDTSAYSCAGAPLFGPDGRCVGMLDLTGVHVPERPALKHLVTQSALSIQNALLLAQPHRLLLRLNWPGHTLGADGDGLIGVGADGHITGANRAAAHMLGLTDAPWPHCSDVFAVSTDHLFDAARAQRPAAELPLWSGLRVQVLARVHGSSPREVRPADVTSPPARATVPLKDLETALIRQAVDEARGNVMQAARTLGISRATVYRKLKKR